MQSNEETEFIKNMKVLLIGINFGNYELKIKQNLEYQGYDVTYVFDTNPHNNIILRLFGKKAVYKANIRYQNRCLSSLPHNIDQVIVIVGRGLTVDFLEKLKKRNPKAIFTLYLWDDVKRVENFEIVRKYYDNIYSFDLKDCQEYGFVHLPLFFTERSKVNTGEFENYTYDIYSAMFNHSDRVNIIKNINRQILNIEKKAKFIICLGRFEYFAKRRKYKDEEGIQYIPKPITENENYRYMSESNAVLDIQFSSQIGLTMRTVECLGMRKKLITTNKSIRYYDFYNETNVAIIDRDNPLLDKTFFDIPQKRIKNDIYEKYSLEHWVKTITGLIEVSNYIGNYKIGKLEF